MQSQLSKDEQKVVNRWLRTDTGAKLLANIKEFEQDRLNNAMLGVTKKQGSEYISNEVAAAEAIEQLYQWLKPPEDVKTVTTQLATTIGSIIHTSFIVVPDKSPSNQYVISASFISSSARYFISPTPDDINPPTAIPESNNTTLDLFLKIFAIKTVNITARKPIAKENRLINTPESQSLKAKNSAISNL